jgi:hypothetical protein
MSHTYSLERAAVELAEWFNGLGISPKVGSRLESMCRAVRATASKDKLIDPDAEATRVQIQAAHDLREFQFIRGSGLIEGAQGAERVLFLAALERAMKDHPIPNAINGKGRDAQAELFAAAAVHYGGLQRVRLREPDVQFLWEGRPLGMAVKRPRSEKNFEATIMDAIDQVSRSQSRGVVWVDMTYMLNPDGHVLQLDKSPMMEDEAQRQRLRDWVMPHRELLRNGGNCKGLLMFYFLEHRVALGASGERPLQSISLSVDVPGAPPGVIRSAKGLRRSMHHLFSSLHPVRWA